MNYKKFPASYWAEIEKTLKQLQNGSLPIYAAFDADGTLWDTDLGENFFQYQIDQKQVPLPEDPWGHYSALKQLNGDPRDAYVWLAQINSGLPVSQVREWAQKAFESIQPKPIFSEQQQLINLLLEHRVQVFIVTASIKWAVEPGARALGLKDENVIGVETALKNGLITTEKVLPITYRQGKVEALLQKTSGIHPFLASGNSTGDIELLQSASHIRLAVSAASRDDKLFKTENELQRIAEKNSWWRHRFI